MPLRTWEASLTQGLFPARGDKLAEAAGWAAMGYRGLRLKPGCLSHHVLCIQLWPQLRLSHFVEQQLWPRGAAK